MKQFTESIEFSSVKKRNYQILRRKDDACLKSGQEASQRNVIGLF